MCECFSTNCRPAVGKNNQQNQLPPDNDEINFPPINVRNGLSNERSRWTRQFNQSTATSESFGNNPETLKLKHFTNCPIFFPSSTRITLRLCRTRYRSFGYHPKTLKSKHLSLSASLCQQTPNARSKNNAWN